jgi:hypothetical protein
MNKIYPFSSAIIMTDDVFVDNGYSLDNTAPTQRNVAYSVAEKMSSNYIGTLLLPQAVTGTYLWTEAYPYLETDWGFIQSVSWIKFYDTKEYNYYTIEGTANVYASIRDSEYGLIDIHYIFGNCACSTATNPYPYKIQVAYEAGLPTGTATQADHLLGLSMYSDLILNEIVGWGNEAAGLVGLKNFRNQSYAESRVNLDRTDFGSSAKAQLIKQLFSDVKRSRYMRLR